MGRFFFSQCSYSHSHCRPFLRSFTSSAALALRSAILDRLYIKSARDKIPFPKTLHKTPPKPPNEDNESGLNLAFSKTLHKNPPKTPNEYHEPGFNLPFSKILHKNPPKPPNENDESGLNLPFPKILPQTPPKPPNEDNESGLNLVYSKTLHKNPPKTPNEYHESGFNLPFSKTLQKNPPKPLNEDNESELNLPFSKTLPKNPPKILNEYHESELNFPFSKNLPQNPPKPNEYHACSLNLPFSTALPQSPPNPPNPPSLPNEYHELGLNLPFHKTIPNENHESGLSRAPMDNLRQSKINNVKKKVLPRIPSLTWRTPRHVDLPFDFQYSYTETPNLAPDRIQEPFSPFGPGRLDRIWDGVAAIRPSSSNSSSKRSCTREEILGEPLTREEAQEIIQSCIKSRKQVQLGRDGLTHNMLIVIHDHWKRDPVVKIKCMGVPTVDMDNVCFQLEDKSGGKIIGCAGGTIYLYRGRYYTRKLRPYIPRMLWKPHSPLYPRLVQGIPDGLESLEEAKLLQKLGLKLLPLCKLSKNGFYGSLVKDVQRAFQVDELVRIDCIDLERSDCKKIGAKLRDLVPCVLITFRKSSIVVWRGADFKRSDNKTPFSIHGQVPNTRSA